jgi:DNA-binding NarL/FixJ family response regulator
MIRVAIADDHQIVIEGLELILQDHSDEIEVVGTANDGMGLMGILGENSVDVIILDISMPGNEDGATLRLIREKNRNAKVLILTMHRDAKNISKMLQLGAKGYLLKNRSGKEAVSAIRALHNGGTYFSADVKDAMMASQMKQDQEVETTPVSQPVKITPTEGKVLELLAEDLSGKLIAAELNVSPKTIETHKKNLMEKIGAKSEKGLVRFAVENGFVRK